MFSALFYSTVDTRSCGSLSLLSRISHIFSVKMDSGRLSWTVFCAPLAVSLSPRTQLVEHLQDLSKLIRYDQSFRDCHSGPSRIWLDTSPAPLQLELAPSVSPSDDCICTGSLMQRFLELTDPYSVKLVILVEDPTRPPFPRSLPDAVGMQYGRSFSLSRWAREYPRSHRVVSSRARAWYTDAGRRKNPFLGSRCSSPELHF